MFDVGFSEMMLIGLIALLVLGPERLPPLIRGLGRWVGRAQRTVRELKTQLENDTSLRELNQVKQSLKSELNAPVEPAAPVKSLSDSSPDAR
ncbi:MAG: hypothetical protein RL434_1124 [Pseudomonadota bacterium]|jgi:sec-independent protein translocase protein TatB